MTQNNLKIKGFAFFCDEHGKINSVLRDDFGIIPEEKRNQIFIHLLDRESRAKAMNFLLDTKNNKAAFNYQLNVFINAKLHTLSFIGILLNKDILIIGASNEEDAIEFTNHLQQINNEQANIIRRLMKEKVRSESQIESDREQSFDDLTKLNNELINLQRELAKKNAELQRLNDTKNRFLGMAAHDLRSPLAIIQSYTEFLIDKSSENLPEKHQKFLRTIYSTTEFMLNLIEDLLDVSKLESGKVELNPEVFDLIAFAENNTELNKPLAQQKGISIKLSYDKNAIPITADRHKLEQVFNNLISNAIKFSYEDTTIQVSITRQNGSVKITIKDQGVGIEKDKIAEIFQPFQKLSTSGTSGEKGTGLGLMIVKRVIEEHNGEIWVDSEVEKGSSFHFTIPLEEIEEPVKTTKKEDETLYSWKNKSILVIEDDPVSLKFIEELLNPTGINIFTATNGKAGLVTYQNHSEINLILIDLSLPDTTGVEVIEKIRESSESIPVIVQTAHTMSKDKEKALMAGSNDYITKPIDQKILFKILNNYLK